MSQVNPSPTPPDSATQRIGAAAIQVAGPALVMLAVGSIAWFLIEVTYSGPLVDRCKWIFTLFTFAAVLISRISIEEGYERAYGYGFLLAIATFIATSRFMEGNLVGLALILGFVWWAAGRLTWDCTFIDQTRDATGQGMIDLAIERATGKSPDEPEETPPAPQPTTDAPQPAAQRGLRDSLQGIFFRRRQPNTPGLWAFYFLIGGLPLFGLGQILMPMNDAAGHRAVAGHFLVYITALLGLLMLSSITGLHRYLSRHRAEIPDRVAWRWVITGSILAISIATLTWLLPRPVPGYSLASLIPRFTTTRLDPSRVSTGNDGQQSGTNDNLSGGPDSRGEGAGGTGGDPQGGNQRAGDSGPKVDRSGGKPSGGKQSGGKQSGGKQSGGKQSGGKQSGGKQSGGKQSGGKQSGGKQSGGKQSGGKQSGGKQSGGKQSGGQQSGGENSSGTKSPAEPQPNPGSGQRQPSPQGQSPQSGESATDASGSSAPDAGDNPGKTDPQSAEDKPPGTSSGRDIGQRRSGRQDDEQESRSSAGGGRENSRNRNSSNQERSADSGAESPAGSQTRGWLQRLGGFLRYLFWCVALLVIAWYAIRHREKILPWIRSFLAELAEFWNRLFRKKPKPSRTPGERSPRPSSGPAGPGFSAFRNPFQSGEAARWSPEQIVRYTFLAFEAWSRERQCPRGPEQTALEFARETGRQHQGLSNEARNLATLYSQLAYARADVSRSAAMTLSGLWDKLAELPPVAPQRETAAGPAT